MQNEASTINEVIARLEAIVQSSIANNEREGYFAALYLRVTRAVKQKIEAGYFEDNPRMERLDVVFANRYLTAYDLHKRGVPCTASWQVAFDLCQHWQPLVMQHLLVGMNAHIGLDLGIAAATVSPGASLPSLQADFDKINLVLSGLVNTVQQELSTIWPLLKPIDWLAGKLDEEIASFTMEIARNAAWKEATQLAALKTENERVAFILIRDQKVAAFGKKMAAPGILLSALLWILRSFEQGSVAWKIGVLNK